MHTSIKKSWLAASVATLVMGGGLALAQYGPPGPPPPPPPGQWNAPAGYNDYYHENGIANPGARRGYATGFEMGQHDRETGHSYRPQHLDEYKNVPDSPGGVPRDMFKHFYREAFLRGYQRGYNGR
jgi:hypothetical protein